MVRHTFWLYYPDGVVGVSSWGRTSSDIRRWIEDTFPQPDGFSLHFIEAGEMLFCNLIDGTMMISHAVRPSHGNTTIH